MHHAVTSMSTSRVIRFGVTCLLLLACSGALGANTNTDGATQLVRFGREFKLRVGGQITLKGTKLRIKFVKVENDSRCPLGVTCVWAGNAAVQLYAHTNAHNGKTLTLNTQGNASLSNEVHYQGYKVKLIGLAPYPRSDRQIAPRDYKATLLISKE